MQGEWKASKVEYVSALEKGKARFRRREKDNMSARLKSARTRFVELTKASKGVGIVDYDGMTKEAYIIKHGTDPEADGHLLKMVTVDGKLESCVLERTHAPGHFRYQQQEETQVKEREVHVDFREFREGHADNTYESLRRSMELDHKSIKQAKAQPMHSGSGGGSKKDEGTAAAASDCSSKGDFRK